MEVLGQGQGFLIFSEYVFNKMPYKNQELPEGLRPKQLEGRATIFLDCTAHFSGEDEDLDV